MFNLFRFAPTASKGDIKQMLAPLIRQGERIMATLADVQAALTKASEDATAEKAEVAAAIQALTEEIRVLQEQIATGSAVTSADLDALIIQVEGIDTQVQDIHS